MIQMDLVIQVGATIGAIVVIDQAMVSWRKRRERRHDAPTSRATRQASNGAALKPVQLLSPSVEAELIALEKKIEEGIRQCRGIDTHDEIEASIDRVMDLVAEYSNVAVDRHFEAAGAAR